MATEEHWQIAGVVLEPVESVGQHSEPEAVKPVEQVQLVAVALAKEYPAVVLH